MEKEEGEFLRHVGCFKCSSGDALSLYQKLDGTVDGFCFSCHQYHTPDDVKEYAHITQEKVTKQNMITQEELEEVQSKNICGWKERRIPKSTCEKYGVYSEGNSDNPIKRFYPITIDDELKGFKIRFCESKDFGKVGYGKANSDMFGQSLFPSGGKFLCITEGEEDCMALYTALNPQGGKYQTPVISPTAGAGSVEKQVKRNYEYITSFDKVIFFMDNDEVGKEATEKACRLLPPGKAYTTNMKLKSPDEYTRRGRGGELVKMFWDAERYSPAGIVAGSQTWDQMVNRAKTVKVSLPDFAKKLQEMNRGGFALGEIINIVAPSGIGKSTIVDRFAHHWVHNSPYKVGIISLEADVGEYTEKLLSIEMGKNLALMEDDEKLQYYADNPDVRGKHFKHLTINEEGEDRYYLLDHQGDTVDSELREKIEYMVRVLGCKVILLDPLTLALSSGKNDDVDAFMSWLLRFVKRENVMHVNVCHVRKNAGDQKANSAGGAIHEEDIKGSGSIFQVGMINILLMRDKENRDPLIRNTTKVVQSKARRTGNTGPAGFWRYDGETGTISDVPDPHMDTSDDEIFLEELGVLEQEDVSGDSPWDFNEPEKEE